MFGFDVLLEIAGLVIAAVALVAFVSVLAVQSIPAMLGVQSPLFELKWTRGTRIEFASALMTLSLPEVQPWILPGVAAKRIILCVLLYFVPFKLQFL